MTGIFVAFLIVFVLLLWVIIGARGSWKVKFLAIAMTLLFSLTIFQSLQDFAGWPTKSFPPDQIEVLWIHVIEPSSVRESPGSVCIWALSARSFDSFWSSIFPPTTKGQTTPRAYHLPYTRDLHEKAEQLKQRIMSGETVRLGVKKIGRNHSISDHDVELYDLPSSSIMFIK